MKHEKSLNGPGLLTNPELQELIKYGQILPAEMLQELQQHAKEKGISLELELASRLLASFVEAEAMGTDSLSLRLMTQPISTKDSMRASKQSRECWLYLYEIQKLRDYLEMKSKLPYRFKETFTLINVKEETKRILEELKANKGGK